MSSSPTHFTPNLIQDDVSLATLETQQNNSLTATSESLPSDVTVQELPPADEGLQAWMFCFSSFVLEVLIWGFGFSYGIFQEYYTSHPPFNKASPIAVAAVGQITLAIQYGIGFPLGFIYGRYPDLMIPSMWFGLVLSVAGLVASSFVNSVSLLILLQGITLGIGGGLLYWPSMFMINEWFVRRRGLACGIIFAGSGIGGFVFPLVVNALLQNLGHRWALRILAAIQGVLSFIALFGVRPRIPLAKYGKDQKRPRFIPLKLPFIRMGAFWAYSTTNFLQAMSYFPVSLYIASYAATMSSAQSATIALSLFNWSGVVGQVLIGYLSDKFPYPWIMFTSTMTSAITAFLLWGFADNLARVYAFAILFGGLSGGFSSVVFVAATNVANPNHEQVGMIAGAWAVFKGVAAVIGPIISGVLLQAGKSVTTSSYGKFGFGPVELFVGSCAVASSLGSIVLAATRPRVRRLRTGNVI